MNKQAILDNLCYTKLVYGRINKKLQTRLTNEQIEAYLFRVLTETDETCYTRTGKNFYVVNQLHNIRITINSSTYRVITADRIEK